MGTRIHTVAALAFDKSKVLLVKHGEAAQHLTGMYGLPGGRLDEGENLLDGAAREFQEETGLTPEKRSMVPLSRVFEAEIPRKGGEILSTFWNVFVVKNYSGKVLATDETIPEWVEINKISDLKLLPNTQKAVLEGLKLL